MRDVHDGAERLFQFQFQFKRNANEYRYVNECASEWY